jgi:glucan phosphoethanolaminetransferase (alkaline phosphatase superfamily)
MKMLGIISPFLIVSAQGTEMAIGDALSVILSNNKILVATLLQFLMGLGLGYYFAKAVKYLIALILVMIAGALLNIWSFGGSIDNILTKYISNIAQYRDEVLTLLKIFGAMLVGPILIGFIIGVIIGLTRK